ncbi:hypothetical protein MC885_021385 [Smutsia gigantea]|nr:hypothetical protein MC885_021385 [Smutsia gigantea]
MDPQTCLKRFDTAESNGTYSAIRAPAENEEPITFCEDAFVSHYRSGAMRQFLQNATQLQLFKQFIDGRLDLLNTGEGFSDVFEEEINMGEYAGSDKLYHQWLSTVRKGSGAILNTVKTKANPAMKTVYKFDITENGCAPTTEEQLPKTMPAPLVETKDPKLREDRRPITVHFGQSWVVLQSFPSPWFDGPMTFMGGRCLSTY